jgi:Putative DNA-binding domain
VFNQHPTKFSDIELDNWITHLVRDDVKENARLDYKQSVSLDTQPDRREVAKDVSSFANEIGGTILYGIPEDERRPNLGYPASSYGLDDVPGLEERIENICVDSIRPHLPELRIRKVALTSFPGKVVYVVWTPESWIGPHMLTDGRYYRRGELRAVQMNEHEVRVAYERSAQKADHAYDALTVLDLSQWITEHFVPLCGSHLVVYPLAPVHGLDFAEAAWQAWLRSHFHPHADPWLPTDFGVRTPLVASNDDTEPFARITSRGVYSEWRHTAIAKELEPKMQIAYVAEFAQLRECFDAMASFLHELGYSGPIGVRYTVQSRKGLLRYPFGRGQTPAVFDGSPRPLTLEFDLPALDLVTTPGRVLKRLAAGFGRAFGFWTTPWIDDDGNVRR